MKVVGEIGCNWTSIKEAKEMIKKAKESGCWAAKFQLFTKEMAEEVKIPTYLALSKSQAKSLVTFGKYVGINVFFTPMDVERVGWCEELDVDFIKVRFKDNLNRELYKAIKKTRKKAFISINEYNDLWQNFVDYKRGSFLYCVPSYPAKISQYDNAFNIAYQGISNHTQDLNLLKKSIIYPEHKYFEIHVKLNKTIPLEDKWSISFKKIEEFLKNAKNMHEM